MTSRHLFLASGVIALASSCASAAIESRSVTITNNTAAPFARVVFYFLGDTLQDADEFNAIRFVDDLALHSAPKAPVVKSLLDAPVNDRLAFQFESESQLEPGGTFEFTMTVDNPFDAYYTLGYRIILGRNIPAPAGVGLASLAFLACARRRR